MMNNYGNWAGNGQFFGLGLFSIAGLGLIALVVFVAIVALKGYSLWTASKRDEKWWFIILLVVNTVGILELIYLYFVAKKWQSGGENKADVSSAPKIVDAEVKSTSGDNSTFVKQ